MDSYLEFKHVSDLSEDDKTASANLLSTLTAGGGVHELILAGRHAVRSVLDIVTDACRHTGGNGTLTLASCTGLGGGGGIQALKRLVPVTGKDVVYTLRNGVKQVHLKKAKGHVWVLPRPM